MKTNVSIVLLFFFVCSCSLLTVNSIAQEKKIQFFKEIIEGADFSSIDGEFVELPTKKILIFSADDGIHGRELWSSDGTPEGTLLLKDILK